MTIPINVKCARHSDLTSKYIPKRHDQEYALEAQCVAVKSQKELRCLSKVEWIN